jgi:hypothetical protein
MKILGAASRADIEEELYCLTAGRDGLAHIRQRKSKKKIAALKCPSGNLLNHWNHL